MLHNSIDPLSLLNMDPSQPLMNANVYKPHMTSTTSCYVCEKLPYHHQDARSLRFYPLTPEHCIMYNIDVPAQSSDKKHFICNLHHNQFRKQIQPLQGNPGHTSMMNQSVGDAGSIPTGNTSNNGDSRPQREWADYEKIMKLKNENSKSDTSRIDLVQLYDVLVRTSSLPLEECYQELYEVFNIKTKNRKDKEMREGSNSSSNGSTFGNGKTETPELNKKLIRNNIKFKIKNLLTTYPHLLFYGALKDFQLHRLQAVPEILLTAESEELKKRFQDTDPQKS